MGNLSIADLPAATLSVLQRRAKRAQQTVEEYVRDLLVEEAGRRSLSDILDDAEAHNHRPLSTDSDLHVEGRRAGRVE